MQMHSTTPDKNHHPSSSRIIACMTALAGLIFTLAGCGVGGNDAEDLAQGDQGPAVAELYHYLKDYGYLANPALHKHSDWESPLAEAPADPQVFDEALERALVLFQQRYGLPADGVLNEQTRRLMKTPRCGFPDFHPGDRDPGALDFTPSGYKWPTGNITYSYSNLTPDLPASTVQSAIDGAFARWAAVAPVTFTRLSGGGDIAIGFYHGDHGDGYPFDGPGGVLAHAYYPTVGDIHFDEAETWNTNGTEFDLATVALHEIGHSLGLDHSSVGNAVMYPYYSGVRRELSSDDIQGIQAIYLNAPDPIYNVPEWCRGFNSVYWTGKPGATYYELYRSFSSSFASPTLIYSGPNTHHFINVSSTWYLRAKSCNAYGCSDYSTQVSASYYSGICL